MRTHSAFCASVSAALLVFGCSDSGVTRATTPGTPNGVATATGGATAAAATEPAAASTAEGSAAVGGGSGSAPSEGTPSNSSSTASDCTDAPPPPEGRPETCANWLEWGECDNDWMQGYCDQTCGRCSASSGSSSSGNTENGSSSSVVPSGTSSVSPLGSDAQTGWASRYWDCCKPHCAWPGNAPSGQMRMCAQNNSPLSDANAQSSCEGGPAYVCWDMAPWAVSENLAYGYAATPAGGSDCGKCYQLDFTGEGQHNASDPGSVAIAGKTMIVQATNVGGDVSSGQFDIMVPGGGVGTFDGCSTQWGTSDLGAQFGGFVTACSRDGDCVADRCRTVFSGSGMSDLLSGCLFYVEWFRTADNPKLRYKQVACPSALTQKSGLSG